MLDYTEALWRCRLCGSSDLLEITHTCCPNCGHERDYEELTTPTPDQQRAVGQHRFAGAAMFCCARGWSPAARYCGVCGDRLEAEAVRLHPAYEHLKEDAERPDTSTPPWHPTLVPFIALGWINEG